MRAREDLSGGAPKIEMFLSDLAVNGHVAASTQNQAFNALLFLYREVLHQELANIQGVRADRPVRVPVVLTVEEVRRVILAMSGIPQIVVKLLYGSGLRLMEALRLRGKDRCDQTVGLAQTFFSAFGLAEIGCHAHALYAANAQ